MSKLYEEVYKLKNILRKGWLIRNAHDKATGRTESDAEHCFSMAILALEIMQGGGEYSDLDQLKVLKMVLFHEFCEIDFGDHTPFEELTKEEKFKGELTGIKRIAKECNMPEILELWLEFEENKTPEAQFVKRLDKFDAILQSKMYSQSQQDENKLFDEFYNYSKDKVKDFDKFL